MNNKQTLTGDDGLQPVGTDCTACDGSQMRQHTMRSKILALNESINTYNQQQPDHQGYFGAHKALFFAKCIEGIKTELANYLANLEKREFEELFSPDFFEMMKDARWLKGRRLEKELLSMKDGPLKAFDIDEEVDGHPTKTSTDLYHWMEQNVKEMRSIFKRIRRITAKLPPESFAAVYEKQSTRIDMEWLQDFYDDKMVSVGKPTFKRLQAFRTRLVADFINTKALRFAYKPTKEEMDEVNLKRVRRELPPGYKFKRFFRRKCAVFKKMIRWEGVYLIIDKEDYGKYICLHMSKLTPDELMELYRVEKLLAMINEAIKRLPPEELEEAQRAEARMKGAVRSPKKLSQFQIHNVSQLFMDNHGPLNIHEV